jgi:hypothetical protein
MAKQLTLKHLEQEVKEFRDRFRHLADDQLFVVWFLRAFVTESETEAADALCGGSKDKNIDAVLIDDQAKVAFIVQGKYRRALAASSEKPNDVRSFAELAEVLAGDDEQYESYCENLAPETEGKLSNARKRIKSRGYRLQLYYVTLGRCGKSLADEADRIARRVEIEAAVDVIDGHQILRLLADYLNGVAPPVPSLDLDMETGEGVEVKGILQRYDSRTDIETWVFPMTSPAIAGLVDRAGLRLFARNIRGFLGDTEINSEIEATLKSKPEYFWYYNNGITIVCDQAEEIRSQGRQILRVRNPQIINGQQTSRTLHRHGINAAKASALVRVIRVPRESESDSDEFDSLVSDIVQATNWQNKILPSDLRANDRRQIMLERELRKLGYWYIRKRQTKGEARRMASSQRYVMVRKEELAQAVAACAFDPVIPRTQKEGLFEDRFYSMIFASKDPWQYLTRYRLLREVNWHARGNRDRGNAKWLVMHIVWQRIGSLLRPRAAAERFAQAPDRDDQMHYLSRAIEVAFSAVKAFYQANRKPSAPATPSASKNGNGPPDGSWHRSPTVDVPTFFKRRGLHSEFAPFFRRSKSYKRFESAMKRFEEALSERVVA